MLHRALVSYSFGSAHWAAAHVVSMAGAFSAGVLVYGYRAAKPDILGWQVIHPTCLDTVSYALETSS